MALSTMSIPANAQQQSSLLTKLPAELRNRIYGLVFLTQINEDGTVDLKDAAPPSKNLTTTCQKVYNECHRMYKAAFRGYCSRIFVVNAQAGIALSKGELMLHITKIRIIDDGPHRDHSQPLRLVLDLSEERYETKYLKMNAIVNGRFEPGPIEVTEEHKRCKVDVSLHGQYYLGPREWERRQRNMKHEVWEVLRANQYEHDCRTNGCFDQRCRPRAINFALFRAVRGKL